METLINGQQEWSFIHWFIDLFVPFNSIVFRFKFVRIWGRQLVHWNKDNAQIILWSIKAQAHRDMRTSTACACMIMRIWMCAYVCVCVYVCVWMCWYTKRIGLTPNDVNSNSDSTLASIDLNAFHLCLLQSTVAKSQSIEKEHNSKITWKEQLWTRPMWPLVQKINRQRRQCARTCLWKYERMNLLTSFLVTQG